MISVTIHELGHALVAIFYRVPITGIGIGSGEIIAKYQFLGIKFFVRNILKSLIVPGYALAAVFIGQSSF